MLYEPKPLTPFTGVRTYQIADNLEKARSHQSIKNAVLGLLSVRVITKLTKPVVEGLGFGVFGKRHSLLPLNNVVTTGTSNMGDEIVFVERTPVR